MEEDLSFISSTIYADEDIIARTLCSRADVTAIDAPLALPRGRDSLEHRSDIHLRECDRELLRMGIRFFPLTLGPMRMLTERGIRLKETLEREGLAVIETYPGGAQDILGIPRKGKGLDRLAEGLRRTGIPLENGGLSHDEMDAVTCALVGIMYLKGSYCAIGDPDEMLMILPAVGA
jgi:hypothetical protein